MDQLLNLPDLYCDACKAAIVEESRIIQHYYHLIKRGIFMDYYYYVCNVCYEKKHKSYTLRSGYSIHKEYPLIKK